MSYLPFQSHNSAIVTSEINTANKVPLCIQLWLDHARLSHAKLVINLNILESTCRSIFIMGAEIFSQKS